MAAVSVLYIHYKCAQYRNLLAWIGMNFLTSHSRYFCDIKLLMSDAECSYQLIFSSITIPKNFILVTINMAMSSIAKLCFTLNPKTIQLVLLIFKDKMFALNQSDNNNNISLHISHYTI